MTNLSNLELFLAIIFWVVIPFIVYLKTKENPQYKETYDNNDIAGEVILSVGIIFSIFLPWKVINADTIREFSRFEIAINKSQSLFDMLTNWPYHGETFMFLLITSPIILAIINMFIRLNAISLYEGVIAVVFGFIFINAISNENQFENIGLGPIFYILIGSILITKSLAIILINSKRHIPFIVTHASIFSFILCNIIIKYFDFDKTEIIELLLLIITLTISFIIAYLVFNLMTKSNCNNNNITPKSFTNNSINISSEPIIATNNKAINQEIKDSIITLTDKKETQTKKNIIPRQVRQIKNFNLKKIFIFCGVSLILLGIVTVSYFFWYKPYSIDRNAPRYYTFTNLNLRSSEDSESKDNIIEMIPYGTELITYGKGYSWARVKANGKEGHVAAYLILTKEDFQLLDGVWGNEDAKKCIGAAHYRLAVIDYLKRKEFSSGATEWQIFAKPYGGILNTVSYPKFSQRKDGDGLIFIVKNNRTNERRLVIYGFTEEPKTPIYKTDVSLEKDLSIRNVECRIEGYDNLWIMITFNDGSYKIIESTL